MKKVCKFMNKLSSPVGFTSFQIPENTTVCVTFNKVLAQQ